MARNTTASPYLDHMISPTSRPSLQAALSTMTISRFTIFTQSIIQSTNCLTVSTNLLPFPSSRQIFLQPTYTACLHILPEVPSFRSWHHKQCQSVQFAISTPSQSPLYRRMRPAWFQLRHELLQLALAIDITSQGISSSATTNDNDEDTNTDMPMKEIEGISEDDTFSNAE